MTPYHDHQQGSGVPGNLLIYLLTSEGTIQRVTLLVGSTNFFLHINTLPCPAWATRSRHETSRACVSAVLDNHSMHQRSLLGQKGQLFFFYKRSLKFNDSAWRVTLLPWTGFLNINGTSRSPSGLPENQRKKAGKDDDRGRYPGGSTPIYGLYRYVPRNRVWFLRFSVLK